MLVFKRILLGVLIFFIVLDVFLFSLYRKCLQTAKIQTPPPTEQMREVPEPLVSTPTPQKTRVLPGNLTEGTLNEVEIEGIIQESPFLANEEYILPVSFERMNGNQIAFEVVLGKKEDKILTLFAKDFVIGSSQEWRERAVSELIPLLLKDDPLKIRFYLQEITQEIMDDPRCGSSCQQRLKKIASFYEVNSRFFEAISSPESAKETFRIGAVSALVVKTRQ